MRDPTLTTNCPDCGAEAGETCRPDCRNDDSFKEPSEITVLRTQLVKVKEEAAVCVKYRSDGEAELQRQLAEAKRVRDEHYRNWEAARHANKLITEGLDGDQVKIYGTAGAKRIDDLQREVERLKADNERQLYALTELREAAGDLERRYCTCSKCLRLRAALAQPEEKEKTDAS